MSAVTSHVESRDPVDESELVCPAELGADPDDRVCVPEPASAHAKLLRFAWLRSVMDELMAGQAFEVVRGVDRKNPDKIYLRVRPGLANDQFPWSRGPGFETVPIFGEPEKMACPTFDLPTGFMALGGTCPASGMCQTTVPVIEREKLQVGAQNAGILVGPTGPNAGSADVSLLETICESCYAQGGNYQYSNAQGRLAVRHLWTRALLASEDGFNVWVEAMAAALAAEDFVAELTEDPRTGDTVRPVRIHSSGDFFSPRYAEAWVALANLFPQVTFWAPTRTWAYPGWNQHWARILRAAIHGNLIVRPSALHFGDYAPSRAGYPWSGPYPYNAAGTTSLRHIGLGADAAPLEAQGRNFDGYFDPRYDWGCQAMARTAESPDCVHALGPAGTPGCRVCWVQPSLRVNFAAH